MGQLPFLVVHGAAVWKVLDLALAGGTLGLARQVRHWRARRRARALAGLRLSVLTAIAEGPAWVRGRLRGGSLATLARGEAHEDRGAGAAWLEGEGGARIELAGAPRVLAGSRARTAMFGVPRGTPAELRAMSLGGPWTLATIGEGDEVVANGVLSRTAREGTDYRDDATAWRLAGSNDVPLEVCAIEPTARAAPVGPAMRATVLAVLLLCGYGALYKVGSVALDRADHTPDRGMTTGIPPYGALAIAAAMPGSRDKAIERASDELATYYGHRGSALVVGDELDALAGGCTAALHQLREVRLDEARASALACGSRELLIDADLYLGNYAEALALAPADPAERELTAVGAGAWSIAASAAHAEAHDAILGDRYEIRSRDDAERIGQRALCREAFYRAHAGVADAFHGIATAPPHAEPTCTLLAALVQPPGQWPEALRPLLDEPAEFDLENIDVRWDAEALLELVGAPPTDDYGDDVVDRIRPRDWLAELATEPSELERVRRAAVALVRGDAAAARAELAAIPPGEDHDVIATMIALHEGSPVPAGHVHPELADAVALRAGTLSGDRDGVYPESCKADLDAAVGKAIAGDGGPLAKVFSECDVFNSEMPAQLPGILPHVTSHRAELADVLRAYRDALSSYPPHHVPFRLVDDLARYRDVAHLAGDDAEAARLQRIIDRHARVLADRDRMIALMMLSD